MYLDPKRYLLVIGTFISIGTYSLKGASTSKIPMKEKVPSLADCWKRLRSIACRMLRPGAEAASTDRAG